MVGTNGLSDGAGHGRAAVEGRGLVVDLFAGGGGASTGIEAALGRPVDLAVNHDPIAIACHERNHPSAVHLTASVFDVDPVEACAGRSVGVLWASPDCTHFSRAKGDVPRSSNIRSLAWVVLDWARAVAPTLIFLENVPEFAEWGPLGEDGRPDRARRGETFRRFVRELQASGYAVEWRTLVACDYGAPTRRPRLFLVARRDGKPIAWPEPTHGPGRSLPWRTAAECIDWSLPCPSIFLTPDQVREQGLTVRRPLAEKTLRRIAEGVRRFVIEAADPFVVQIDQQGGKVGVSGIDAPVGTAVTKNNRAVVVPTLIQTGHGERPGQAPRVPGLHKPLGAVCAGGCKRGLVAALLTKHYGGVVGHELTRPAGTVTGTDHHALTTATLSREDRSEQVRAFLRKYYGEGGNLSGVGEPVHTITAKDRMGLVVVRGVEYRIVDIGMRMLEPAELLRAQFGRFAEGYRLDAVKESRRGPVPISKADQVRLIGNSVAPEVAEAVVRVNAKSAVREVAA